MTCWVRGAYHGISVRSLPATCTTQLQHQPTSLTRVFRRPQLIDIPLIGFMVAALASLVYAVYRLYPGLKVCITHASRLDSACAADAHACLSLPTTVYWARKNAAAVATCCLCAGIRAALVLVSITLAPTKPAAHSELTAACCGVAA